MKKTILFATLAAFGLQLAQAHRTWVLPSSTVLSGDKVWVTFDACASNNIFFVNHRPLQPNTLSAIGPDGKEVELNNVSKGAMRTTFDVELKQEGTYRVGVVRAGHMAFWREGEERKSWTGTKEEMIKQGIHKKPDVHLSVGGYSILSYVTLGKPSKEVLAPTGKGLEVTFKDSHPNDLIAKETTQLVFQLNGKPASDLEVTVVPEGDRFRNEVGEIKVKTNARGECSVTWPTAGRYWLEALVEGTAEPVEGVELEEHSSVSLTLEVFPE
ncbi:putative GH25 family protein [Roseimicrobium gellanilyticum]|uniref:Putative GH25 family protein n=1 Tax=Roseimicrobium gellanilyticum TaxID=748857 RepID=A0A366HY03_9BACT|nr:DUF4198 domain-containing protein [Roseimicrobium gellanilyticum]RBP48198.1 putative GH25 family protein [Roseimicrobium gellanilyticum]